MLDAGGINVEGYRIDVAEDGLNLVPVEHMGRSRKGEGSRDDFSRIDPHALERDKQCNRTVTKNAYVVRFERSREFGLE